MAATIIYDELTSHVPQAAPDGDNLWIPVSELQRATGWDLKPEGACLGAQCVPIRPETEREIVNRDTAAFNLAAFARMLGQPIAHDNEADVWVFGQAAAERQHKLLSLEAPDFTLPDIDGKMHSLSEYRGKKVFLVTWASW